MEEKNDRKQDWRISFAFFPPSRVPVHIIMNLSLATFSHTGVKVTDTRWAIQISLDANSCNFPLITTACCACRFEKMKVDWEGTRKDWKGGSEEGARGDERGTRPSRSLTQFAAPQTRIFEASQRLETAVVSQQTCRRTRALDHPRAVRSI